ncbi:hypothetical protein E2C01_023462 [Portunus trituberculatus]|uniref:Uncharacterized protein n=1 Tax=Portunus trituberculatus TaxID=210409 RepID=A0A5B7E893_PORTR|nr:hypothetical protein [Portunus trituberculatus]
MVFKVEIFDLACYIQNFVPDKESQVLPGSSSSSASPSGSWHHLGLMNHKLSFTTITLAVKIYIAVLTLFTSSFTTEMKSSSKIFSFSSSRLSSLPIIYTSATPQVTPAPPSHTIRLRPLCPSSGQLGTAGAEAGEDKPPLTTPPCLGGGVSPMIYCFLSKTRRRRRGQHTRGCLGHGPYRRPAYTAPPRPVNKGCQK